MKNPTTAIREGSCKLLRPEIACPEVHPPAYLAPNPIRNPPDNKMIRDLGSVKASVAKSSFGR